MTIQVEAYMSGRPCRERRFEDRDEAEAYRKQLHADGFYFVNLFDLETADRAWPLDDPRARPWAGL